jgi:hypothetical protein
MMRLEGRMHMDRALLLYRQLVDSLVELRPAVAANRARSGVWHREPPDAQQERFNQLLASLSEEQCTSLAEMLQIVRDGGIHDTLAFLNDHINLRDLRLVYPDSQLPVEPYGTEMHYDWTARVAGHPWPGE